MRRLESISETFSFVSRHLWQTMLQSPQQLLEVMQGWWVRRCQQRLRRTPATCPWAGLCGGQWFMSSLVMSNEAPLASWRSAVASAGILLLSRAVASQSTRFVGPYLPLPLLFLPTCWMFFLLPQCPCLDTIPHSCFPAALLALQACKYTDPLRVPTAPPPPPPPRLQDGRSPPSCLAASISVHKSNVVYNPVTAQGVGHATKRCSKGWERSSRASHESYISEFESQSHSH
jgi:hypothetical protein